MNLFSIFKHNNISKQTNREQYKETNLIENGWKLFY